MFDRIIFLLFFCNPSVLATKISVCFYTNWAQYRNGVAKFLPENIDPALCSHISYAFAKINLETHLLEEYEWNDDAMIPRVNALKDLKPELKTMLSVGGWTHDQYQQRYSSMVATAETRKIFIDSAIVFLSKYKFDGLSLDWEWPGNRGSPATDKQKFTQLVQELLAAFQQDAIKRNATRFLLSASVGAGPKVIAKAYEIALIGESLDWVNLMSYDLHGSWENVTGCTTAMKGPTPTVPLSLQVWLDGGMPANKLSLGLAAYGRSFQLKNMQQADFGAPINGPGKAGSYTKEEGSLAFYEICQTNWNSITDYIASEAGSPYASKDSLWVGYDTIASIKEKVETLVNAKDLAGFSFWALDEDDFTGELCNLGKYPLLTAANHAMKENENNYFNYRNHRGFHEFWENRQKITSMKNIL